MILGIIGGAFGLIATVLAWAFHVRIPVLSEGFGFTHVLGFSYYAYWFMLLIMCLVILIGGAVAQRSPVAGGVMMLVAAGSGFLLTHMWFICGLLGLVGGVLALAARGPQYGGAYAVGGGYPVGGGQPFVRPPGAQPHAGPQGYPGPSPYQAAWANQPQPAGFCAGCGAPVQGGGQFCSGCGRRL
jgi:hypothetical protein